ncbi:MAG: hypothetical protein GX783_00460 [Clostridiales bacterium]|nr:hypothetical protein [Clostridiales bacterium]
MGGLVYTDLPIYYKNSGADFMVYDLEHGNYTPESIFDMLTTSRRVDMISIVRVADYDYHCISRVLDMGADGILLPRVETEAHVENAINCMRFYPKGKKGVGGKALKPGETIDRFNEDRLLFIQIESPLGVSNLDKILERYGDEIAGVIIGPSDMSIACGCNLDIKAAPVVDNIRRTIEICASHNKSVGIFTSESDIQYYYDQGMNIFWTGTEMSLIAKGISCIYDIVETLGQKGI